MYFFFPHIFQYHKLSNQIIRDSVVVFPFLFALFSHLFFSTYTHLLFSSSSIETQWDKSWMTVPSNETMREEKREEERDDHCRYGPPSLPFLLLLSPSIHFGYPFSLRFFPHSPIHSLFSALSHFLSMIILILIRMHTQSNDWIWNQLRW